MNRWSAQSPTFFPSSAIRPTSSSSSRATASSTCSRTRTRAFTSARFNARALQSCAPPSPPPSLVVDAPLSVGRISRRSSAARAASLNSRRSTKSSSTSACASSRATTCRRSSRSSRRRGRQAPSAVAHLAERAPLTYAALPPRRAATDEDTRERAIHYRVETRRCNTLARGRRLRRGRIGPRLVC